MDTEGHAALAEALEQFGDTPVIIRTASGKWKLWYRHNGERRLIRPTPERKNDLLGGGYTIAPPSYRQDLDASYRFVAGGLADLDRLGPIRADALEASEHAEIARRVVPGQRNIELWRFCMHAARHCDDVEALIDFAETFCAGMPEPLPRSEIIKTAHSAWKYEQEGRNYIGLKRPQANDFDREMDNLADEPDAFYLLHALRRWHSNREEFAIAPRAMASAGNPPWSWHRISRARGVLVERGYIEELAKPSKGMRQAGRYRLKAP